MHTVSTQTAEYYTWGEHCDGWHLLKCSELSVIQEQMPPQTSEVTHSHTRSRQFFYVISGTLSILCDGKLHKLTAEHGLQIDPTIVHRVFNDSNIDVRFIVISSPPSHQDRINAV